MKQQLFCTLLTCAAFSAVFTHRLSAQELTASIRGTVTDATGAAVPGAEVKALEQQTHIATTVPSEGDGSFAFLHLPVGTYDVTVTRTGFRPSTTHGIVLSLNAVYNLPVKLEVGQVSETVEVEANPVQVETTTTQLGTVVESQQIVDLPLNGRNWTQLQQLAPGVVSTSDRFGTYATNGSQSQQNSFLINGMDAIDLPLNTPLVIPSPDAIGEFNLVSSSLNPEYGRNSGGILNAVIKSGTNQFHGSAFEFYRDTFLDDRNLFQLTKPVYHQNQFGGTIGGPIIKNHTFFMFSYQGTRFVEPSANGGGQTTVFSAAERNGLFPDIATSSATSPFPLVGSNGGTYPAGTPYSEIFPTGQIPTADFNPIAQKLLSFVPLPNSPGNLYSFNPSTTGVTDQEIIKIDHSMKNDTFWFTSIIQRSPSTDAIPFTGASLPGFGDVNKRHTYANSASWTHTFNPTTLNELRVSWLRFNFDAVEPQTPVLPSSVGFTGISPQDPAGAGLPVISLTGYFTLGFSSNGPQPRIDSTYQLTDGFSKIHGNHTLKFGYDGERYQVGNPFFGNNGGNFSFGGSGTYSTGDPGADFLLGIPDSYSQGSGGWIDARTYEHYFYAQDSWKALKNFTINFGAGYQIDTPLVQHHFGGEAMNCFRPGEQSQVFPTAPVGLVFPGDPGCSQSGYYQHYGDIGPRFGIAWAPNSKTSIRSGFGIYYNRVEEELMLQDLGAPPFSVTSGGIGDIGGNPSFANPWVDISTGQSMPNKFPFVPPQPGNKTLDFSFFEPMSLNVVNPNFTSPYAMNYNLTVERQLPGAMILRVGYVGSQGRHLEMAYEGNPITPAGTAACAASSSCISNRLLQQVLYPTHTEYAPGDIIASAGTQSTVGVSHYNSMQVNLNKRLTKGLLFQASYTWSHSIDDTSGFEQSSFGTRGTNPYNFAFNRGDSTFDARQRLVINYDYELPHLSRYVRGEVAQKVLDGWHLAGITTLQKGFPITVADSAFPSLTCGAVYSYYGCPDTANGLTAVQTYDPRTSGLVNTSKNASNTTSLPYYYFNPNSFGVPAYGVLGTAGRNFFHGPGINNTDLSLSKRIIFTEARFIELRLEGYNVFNHTQFSTSASSGGSAVSGDFNSANFGRILAAAPGRTVQLAAKLYF
jgi:carboxypeptidase family protein